MLRALRRRPLTKLIIDRVSVRTLRQLHALGLALRTLETSQSHSCRGCETRLLHFSICQASKDRGHGELNVPPVYPTQRELFDSDLWSRNVKKCVIVPMWSRQLYATERRPLYLLNVLFYFLCLSLFKAVVNSAAVNLHSRSFSRVVALAPIEALSWGALHSKTGRDRSRQLRLWLVERRDRS